MNCLYEAMASLWLSSRARFMPAIRVDEISLAEEGLVTCRNNYENKRLELERNIVSLERDIELARSRKDNQRIRAKVIERKRLQTSLQKINNYVQVVDRQIETLQSNELDKELLQSLKMSNKIMKKAGLSINSEEVEHLMNELDERVHETSEMSQILSTPMQSNEMYDIIEDDQLADLQEEQDPVEEVAPVPQLPQRPESVPVPAPQVAALTA